MQSEKIEKLEKLQRFLKDQNLAIFEEVLDLNKSLNQANQNIHQELKTIAEKEIVTVKGEDGRSPIHVGIDIPENPTLGDLWYKLEPKD